jgi:hypothetical protein
VIVVALCLVSTSDTIRTMDVFKLIPKRKIAPLLTEGMKVSHANFGVGIIKKKVGRHVFRVTFEDHSTKNIYFEFLSLI